MQIAVIYSGGLSQTANAGARRVVDICTGLAKSGAKVSLLYPAHKAEGENVGYSFQLCPVSTGSRKWLHPKFSFLRTVERIVRHQKFDVALFYSPQLECIPIFSSLKRSGVLVVNEQCDLLSRTECELWKKPVFLLGERLLPRLANLNIPISTGIEARMLATAPTTPTLLVPGLVDTREFREMKDLEDINDGKTRITYAGTWYQNKGLQNLLLSFSQVARTVDNCVLEVTGERNRSRWEIDARKIAEELGIRSKVRFLGFVTKQEHAAVVRRSDILVCPHLPDKFSEFAFPTKVAEYAGVGGAIVSSRIGDVEMYLKNRVEAMLYNGNSPEELTQRLLLMASDPVLRRKLGDAAFQVAANYFSPQKNGDAILRKLRALSNKKFE